MYLIPTCWYARAELPCASLSSPSVQYLRRDPHGKGPHSLPSRCPHSTLFPSLNNHRTHPFLLLARPST